MVGYKIDEALNKQMENVTIHSFPQSQSYWCLLSGHIHGSHDDKDGSYTRAQLYDIFRLKLIWLLSLLSANLCMTEANDKIYMALFAECQPSIMTDWLLWTLLIMERAMIWNMCPQKYRISLLPRVLLPAPPFINLQKVASNAKVSHRASLPVKRHVLW